MNKGFTLVETILAISMALILTVVTSQIVVNFYGAVVREQVSADLTSDSKLILRNLVDELRIASAVRSTNEIIDPNEPAGGWNTDVTSAIIVIATPVINTSGDIEYDTLNDEPLLNEIVYFAEGDTLYKRIIANPNASDNRLLTTCPASLSSTSCPPDPKLTENFSDLFFEFYDQNNNLTAIIEEARSIDITVTLDRPSVGQSVEIDNNVRITLRNRDA